MGVIFVTHDIGVAELREQHHLTTLNSVEAAKTKVYIHMGCGYTARYGLEYRISITLRRQMEPRFYTVKQEDPNTSSTGSIVDSTLHALTPGLEVSK